MVEKSSIDVYLCLGTRSADAADGSGSARASEMQTDNVNLTDKETFSSDINRWICATSLRQGASNTKTSIVCDRRMVMPPNYEMDREQNVRRPSVVEF